MIKTIAHLADIHIKNDLSTHSIYRIQFDKIYKKIKSQKPDRIVIVGDLVHDFINISNEVEILATEFLINLSQLTKKLIVTEGNHCIRKSNLSRLSSLKTIVDIIKKSNPKINIIHLDHSGFFEDENVVWVNHSHLEKDINPWSDIKHEKIEDKIYIDLFHDPVYGSVNDNGFKFNSKNFKKISNFKGDFALFGDIHKYQTWNKYEYIEIDEKDLEKYLNNGWEIIKN